MKRLMTAATLATALLCGLAAPTMAQTPPGFSPPRRVAIQPEPAAIPLYAGTAPGSAGWTQREVWTGMGNEIWIRNVTKPTLTPFLPEPGKATGAAVLVVPGGGFRFVSINNEGWPIARWLAERGVAAFVLKYRTMATPDSEDAFFADMAKIFATPRTEGTVEPEMIAAGQIARADAQTALRMIRARAGQWGVDPQRVGMLGFSAGAMTTMLTTLADAPDARPDFIAPIYGEMLAVTPPPKPQPMFAALASDDSLFNQQGFGLVESWQKAGGSVELHYYTGGGHGFGSHKRGTTSDLWFGQFMAWMEARGLLKPAP
jgi:acetyl esterase/lipase